MKLFVINDSHERCTFLALFCNWDEGFCALADVSLSSGTLPT